MTRNVFIALLVLTIVAVIVGAKIAERYAAPGIGRTLIVALFTALIVFPAGWYAERRGWIRGKLDLSRPRGARATSSTRTPGEEQAASPDAEAGSEPDSGTPGKRGDHN